VNLNELPPTVGAAIGLTVGSVQRSYAPVYLTAPRPSSPLRSRHGRQPGTSSCGLTARASLQRMSSSS
jgi:hypothetical protein